MTNKAVLNGLFPAGAVFVFIASVLKYFEIQYVEYLFGLGALLVICYHGLQAYNQKDGDRNLQRLYRMALFSSLFLAVATYFMFTASNSWIVMVLIYAVTTLYLSFRIK